MLDAREFGAVGDGQHDDTSSLQKAIDRAAAKGDTVHIPAGVFMTSTLTLPPHVGLQGEPTFSWKEFGGSILRLRDPSARCLIDMTRGIGATINGLCLDGADLGDGVVGILVDKPDYGKTEDTPRIERCQVSHFTGDGIHLGRIWCYSVRGSMISYNRGHGLAVRGWDGFVLDNWFSFNGGAGIASFAENNAATITANRIEWNRGGGIRIIGGSHYNITGNYIDRSGGPAIRFAAGPEHVENPRTIVGNVGFSTITGNVLYRSGRPLWCPLDSPDNAHLIIDAAKGLVVSGNTLVVGRDDDDPGSAGFGKVHNWSPSFGIVCRNAGECIIKDNMMHRGALRELIVSEKNDESVLVKDNVGSLFEAKE